MMNASLRRFAPAATAAASMAALAFVVTTNHRLTACEDTSISKRRPKIVFLGTGSSTGCPKPICPMLFQGGNGQHQHSSQQALRDLYAPRCQVSNLASKGDPRYNRDYRNNPSLLISHFETGECKNVIIDVGKTFREGALRWMPVHAIDSIDAIILTHHHMDAVAGLDDVRGFQHTIADKSNSPISRVSMSVFLSRECLDQVSNQFPWLFPKNVEVPPPSKDGKPEVKRDVAALQVHIIDNYQSFDAKGLTIIPLPVLHGEDLESLGFAFTIRGEDGQLNNIVYISDISRMIPETMDYIQTKLPPTDLLVVDALLSERPHPVHYNLQQAIDLSKEIGAKKTYLVGMSCDDFLPHDEMNAKLTQQGETVQLAHDGLVVYL